MDSQKKRSAEGKLLFVPAVRVSVGVLLISLLVLLTVGRLVEEAVSLDPREIGRDVVTLYEKRFAPLKGMKGVVGYITDADLQSRPEDVKAVQRFVLTQYALAPLIVLNIPQSRLVVGNFHEGAFDPKLPANQGFVVLLNFGDVVLLRNEAVP
jgi:hypothetical protein